MSAQGGMGRGLLLLVLASLAWGFSTTLSSCALRQLNAVGPLTLELLTGRGVVRELIVDVDDETRRLASAVVESRLPQIRHHASFQLFAEGESPSRLVWIADVLPNELVAEICLRVERGGHHHKADAGERSQERLASVLTSRRHPPRRSRANRCTGSWAILEIPTEQRDKPREVGPQSAGVRQVLGTLDLISNCRDRTQDSRLSAHARVFDGAHAPLPSALPSGLPSESASDALTLRYVNVQGYHAAAEKWRRIKEMRQRVDDAGTMHVSV